MLEKYYKNFYCKIDENIENIHKALLNNKVVLSKESYILDIVMINNTYFKNNICSINDVSDIVLIRDLNNETKEIILFNNELVIGHINKVLPMKALLERLGYNEIFNINEHRYTYFCGSITFNVVIVRNLGVFLECNNKNDIINIIKIFKKANFKYHVNKENANYFNLSVKKYIEGKNL